MIDLEVNAKIIEQFDKTAENYSKDTIFSRGNDLEIVLKEMNPNSTMAVLDVATGPGHVAIKISPFVKSVYAIDITHTTICPCFNNRITVFTDFLC